MIPTVPATAAGETMRDRFGSVVSDLVLTDERVFVLLAAISVERLEPARSHVPERVVNAGIMEQTVVSAAAGLAVEGFIPFVHSIVPFIVHRPYEQIRDDFLYQGLGLNIISIGASYDYAAEGYTHHGPDDVPALRALAGVQVIVPGTPAEFEALLRQSYDDGAVTYHRLSARSNRADRAVRHGRLEVLRQRDDAAVVIAVGPMLDPVLAAIDDRDVTIAYCTTVAPFDADTLRAIAGATPRVAVVEPYYAGALVPDIVAAVAPQPVRVEAIGVPRVITTAYGSASDHDRLAGLTTERIAERLRTFLSER